MREFRVGDLVVRNGYQTTGSVLSEGAKGVVEEIIDGGRQIRVLGHSLYSVKFDLIAPIELLEPIKA